MGKSSYEEAFSATISVSTEGEFFRGKNLAERLTEKRSALSPVVFGYSPCPERRASETDLQGQRPPNTGWRAPYKGH